MKGFFINIFFITILTFNITVFADPGDKFDQDKRARQIEEESLQRTKEDMVRLKQEKKTLGKIQLPEETPSFYIKEIKIRGSHIERFPWVGNYLSKYTNRNIGLEGINLLITKINEAFIDKGYITTKLYIQEQDLTTGMLTFDLVAGTVKNISFDQDTYGTWRNAFPIVPGDVLNIRNIEQGLEQMRRLSSQDVDIDIQPAEEMGQSNLVIKIKRTKPWKIITTIDDSGTLSTGKNQATFAWQLENIFNLNDIFYFSYNKDAASQGEIKGTRANSIYYSVTMGKQTLSINVSNNKYHQTVITGGVPFVYSGTTDNINITLTHLLMRNQNQKSNLEFTLLSKRRRSYLNDTEIITQRQSTTALKLGVTHRQYIGNIVFDAALRFQKGVPWLGAKSGPTDHMPDSATTRYNMWLFDININTPISLGRLKGRYNLNIRGQKTNNLVYGSDFFSIGGRYTVRGFDGEQSLSAENGFTIRNEWSLEYVKYHQIYFNLDYGKVHGQATQWLLGKELLGCAVGLKGNINKGMFQYDLFVGWPLKKPDGFKTRKQAYGFMLTMQI